MSELDLFQICFKRWRKKKSKPTFNLPREQHQVDCPNIFCIYLFFVFIFFKKKSFNFLGNNIKLIARTEHDAVVGTSEKDLSFMNIKALNEWDSRYSGNIDWRQKLDVQRGAVLANELKHNSCKLSRYV